MVAFYAGKDEGHPIFAPPVLKPAAKRRAVHFVGERLPRFLGYFERTLA